MQDGVAYGLEVLSLRGAVCQVRILLACDIATVGAAYDAATSLAWRDAGALLQTLGMTATAAAIGFCPLALLGGEVRGALAIEARFESVGVAVVGL